MKVLLWGVLALFLGFWMMQSPDSMAAVVRDGGAGLWNFTTEVFGALINFLDSLVR